MDLSPAILESTPYCIAVLDRELRLVAANNNFAIFLLENFGIEIGAGDSILASVPDEWRLRCQLRLEEILGGQCMRVEESFQISGFTRHFDIAYQPLHEAGGNWSKVVVSFEEITTRKRRESRLLDEEAHLKELIATRETLLSVISHDLRSPIFQLNGLLYLIRQAAGARDEARLQMQAEDLEERIAHLTHTIDNLLSWSNLQRQSLAPQVSRFAVQPLFEHAIGLLKPAAQRKGVRVYTRNLRELELASDREMVAFIVRNLINNAIKFSNQSGRIEVIADASDHAFKFQVRDHGVGIGPDRVAELRHGTAHFTETGTWGERGTGLGLKLCYEFAGRLRGNIQFDSELGVGTTVTVTLPQLELA